MPVSSHGAAAVKGGCAGRESGEPLTVRLGARAMITISAVMPWPRSCYLASNSGTAASVNSHS